MLKEAIHPQSVLNLVKSWHMKDRNMGGQDLPLQQLLHIDLQQNHNGQIMCAKGDLKEGNFAEHTQQTDEMLGHFKGITTVQKHNTCASQ